MTDRYCIEERQQTEAWNALCGDILPPSRPRTSKGEQADGVSMRGGYHAYLKVSKRRRERRRANADPECLPSYGRYCGWET